MFDTHITVVGTALSTPELKTTAKSNTVVTSFRVASHARRFDKETQRWVDGPSLFLKVNCWRQMAENVCGSITSGDPIVVYGRIATREWKTEQGESRITYEMEADAVGHDLSRGKASFTKLRLAVATTVIDDADAEQRVHGELTRTLGGSVPGDALSGEPDGDDTVVESFDDLGYGNSYSSAGMSDPEAEAMEILRTAGLDPSRTDGGEDDTDEAAVADVVTGSGGPSARSRRRGRQPVPA